MPSHRWGGRGGSKTEDMIRDLIVLFVAGPMAILILCVLAGLPWSVIGGFESLYYILVILLLAVKGLEWLDKVLG